MKTLGSRIAHYRKAANLSQAALAKACGWASQSRVGNYELNTREPTLDDIAQMAKVLGVNQGQLLLGSQGYPVEAEAPSDRVTLGKALFNKATPRSQAIIDRIMALEAQGSLTDEDLQILEKIIERFGSKQ